MISLRTSTPTTYNDTTTSSLRFLADICSLQHPIPIDKICFNCRTITAIKWYKNPSEQTQNQCQRCYAAGKRALNLSGGSGKTCFNCHTTTTTRWYKNPSEQTQNQCQRCYGAGKRALNLSGGSRKTCFNCHTTTTHKWYKNSFDQDECQRCYQATRRALKRKAKTLEPVNTKNPRLNATPFTEREVL